MINFVTYQCDCLVDRLCAPAIKKQLDTIKLFVTNTCHDGVKRPKENK